MTKFAKNQFEYHGGYLTYHAGYLTYQGKFIARFKHAARDKAGFQKFLIANFEVEEYFAQQDAGMSPVTILETKGYISKTVQNCLVLSGFAPTQEGRQAYLNKIRADTQARLKAREIA